jgi:quinoprotein glucose dehydrogenase
VITAIDLTDGSVKWERPLGAMPGTESVPGSAEWGSVNLGGPIVTAGGLVFIGASADGMIRALDVETGAELWRHELPAGGQATPMTYRVGGKQYVVIAAGGHSNLGTPLGDYLVAFALP